MSAVLFVPIAYVVMARGVRLSGNEQLRPMQRELTAMLKKLNATRAPGIKSPHHVRLVLLALLTAGSPQTCLLGNGLVPA